MTAVAVINFPAVGQWPSDQTDPFLDPAQQVLLQAEEAKKKRKQEETKIALEKIHDRIDYALHEFEGPEVVEQAPSETDVNFELVEDPVQLYELLSNSRIRARYYQRITVFIVGIEEQCEERERLLHSLQEFFLETQAGNTQQMLEEVAAEEVDFDEATLGLESALQTAQDAAERLLEIKREMGQLFTIVATYPDTKKGRKKLDKALLKAQEEVQVLTGTLQTVQSELEQTKEKCSQLQKTAEAKGTECAKLRKTVEEMKKVQLTNDSLKAELASIQADLKQAQADLEKAKNVPMKMEPVVKEVVKVDEEKVRELEAALAQQREAYQKLVAERNELEGRLQTEVESIRVEHESEIQDMRVRYEEQLKSLMEEDEFEETGSREETDGEQIGGEEGRGEGGEEMAVSGVEVEAEVVGDVPVKQVSLVSESFVERLKTEQQSQEKRLQQELADVKTKSRKMATALRAQLADTQNKHVGEVNSLQKEIGQLRVSVEELQQMSTSLQEKLAGLQGERDAMERELQESVVVQQEQLAVIHQLQEELERATSDSPPEKVCRAPELVNRSAQWSTLSGQSTPKLLGVSSFRVSSQATPSVIPMDEVLHTDMGSTSLNTPLDASMQQMPHYGSQAMPFFMDQSAVSLEPAPFGSPLHAGSAASETPTRPRPMSTLPLIMQPHLSPSPPLHLTFDHPVMVEWTKAYDLVIKFRDRLVQVLSEQGSLSALAEELGAVEVHHVDRSQEVQGQITQMRFSLALLLHQMEQTVEEGLAQTTSQEEGGEKEEEEEEELHGMMVQLKRRLRQTEDTHRIELQESKETIANLSSRVESLKLEVAKLKSHAPLSEEGGGTIMFTRLDSERNTKTLKSALERDRISPSTYQKVSDSMEEYLAISPRRLAHMSKRCQDKTVAGHLIEHVQRSCRGEEQAAKIVEEISTLEKKRQLEFTVEMNRLSQRREQLAHTLTHTLSSIEKKAGVFLIKPVYAPQGPHTLITPLARPLPTRKPLSRPRTQPTLHSDRSSTPHPSMRLVSTLLHSRQSQREQGATGSTCISGQATPHLKRRGTKPSGLEWNVDMSRPSGGATPFSPLVFESPPPLPKMMELEILRHRQPETLLGHLLPHLHTLPTQHSHPPPSSPPKLAPLPESSLHATEIEFSPPYTSPLPPIHVPSKVDGPLAVM